MEMLDEENYHVWLHFLAPYAEKKKSELCKLLLPTAAIKPASECATLLEIQDPMYWGSKPV